MIISTADAYGNPQCPYCQAPVEREGQFDTAECWQRVHAVIYEMEVPLVEMNYLDITEQPWYGEGIGLHNKGAQDEREQFGYG